MIALGRGPKSDHRFWSLDTHMGGSTSGLIILILKGETEEKKVMGPKQTLAP